MARTRNGKLFRHDCNLCEQNSPWAAASEVLLVLLDYLDFSSLLTGRLVCQAWRGTCSTPVKQLQLEQPASAKTALALGRKAAAAFSSATILCLKLLAVQEPPIDLTTDDIQLDIFGPESLGCPAAGAALLRQLSKAGRLQQLQPFTGWDQACTCLPALLKAAPQLLVLDLSCCFHNPADLLVLAQLTPKLQQLLLHCQAFTTLSGRRIRHGNPEWGRHGGNTRYRPEHLAALAHLPQLQLLEVALPARGSTQHMANWFGAVGSLTGLTGLHVVAYGKFDIDTPASVMTALSSLTRLKELRSGAGGRDAAQAKSWGTVLSCMPHLTRLELVDVDAGDPLLCAIGHSLPQLQLLVLDSEHWDAQSTKEGADAVAHVKHIELFFGKHFDCSQNLQLVQVPGVKRVLSRWLQAWHDQRYEMQGGPAWTQETCICQVCFWRRRRG